MADRFQPVSHDLPTSSQREVDIADALREVALLTSCGQGLRPVLDAILEQLGRVVDYDSASISLLEREGWRIIAGRGFPRVAELIGAVLPMTDEKQMWMQENRQPLIIRDVQSDPRWIPFPGAEYIHSWIGAPLLAQGKMIGTLNLDKADVGYYRPEDAELVMAFANQAAVVIENTRLLEAERKRSAQLSVINAISQQVLSILDPEALLDFAVEAIHTQFGYYYVDVFLVDPTGQTVVFQTSSRPEYAPLLREQKLSFRIGEEGLIGHVAESGQPHIAKNVRQEPHYVADPLLPAIRSEMVIPIRAGGRVIGVLDFNSEQFDAFDEGDLFVAQSMASQLALGLENARLYESTQRRVAELEAVRQASLSLTSSLELQKVLETILESAISLLSDVQDAHVFLYEAERLTFGAALWADGRKSRPWAEPRPEGLTYSVARQGEPIIVPDMATHPLFDGAPPDWRGSIIGLPLKIGERVVGVMSVAFHQPCTLPETELNTLYLLADQAAIAIENARLFASERQRRRELQSIQATATALSAELHLDTLLNQIVTEAAQAFHAEATSLMLWDEKEESMVVRAHAGLSAEYARGQHIPRAQVDSVLAASGEASYSYVADLGETPLGDADMIWQEGLCSVLSLPLEAQLPLTGVLNVYSKEQPRTFSPTEIELAEAFASQAAIAIRNARLFEGTREHVVRLEKKTRDLEVVHELSKVLSSSLDLGHILEAAVEQLAAVFDADHTGIMLFDQECEHGTVVAEYPATGALRETFPVQGYLAAEQIISTQVPIMIEDVRKDPRMAAVQESMYRLDIRSMLIAPLIVKGKTMGSIGLDAIGRQRRYDDEAVALAQTIANQVAYAIENARLFGETEDRIRELAAVATVSQAMTTLELDDVLDSIADNALDAVQAEISSVYLLDPDRKHLIPRSVRGMRRAELEQGIFALGEGTIGQVAMSGQPLVVQEMSADQVFIPKSDAARLIRNTLTVPLAVKGDVIGTLEVCNKIGAASFADTDQRLLSAFAAQAAVAIDNARLYQEVSRHLEEVLTINRVAAVATSTLDFDQAIHRSLVALLEMPKYERAHVLLLDRASNELLLHPASTEYALELLDKGIPLGQGICGRVAQNGTPIRVADVRQEPNYVVCYMDTLSEIAVPLGVGDRILGVLDVQSTQLDAFSESDQRLLTTLASQLSTVIDNARLFQETRQRVRELTALTQVSQALNEAQDLDTILNIVLDETFSLLDCQEGSIILVDPSGGDWLRIVAERGIGEEIVEAFNTRPVYAYEGTYQRALSTGQIVEVADTLADPDFLHDVGSRARQVTNIPLVTERGAIGLIAVDRLPPDETTRRLLSTLAGMAAVAIDKERLHQETADRLAEVSTLYTLSTQITSSLSTSSVLESIVTILKLTLDCRACCIFLVDSTEEYLKLEAGTGLSPTWKETARLRIGEGVSGRVIDERRSIYVPDTRLEPDFIFFDPNIRSLLVVPLIIRDKAIGTLSIDDIRPNAFENELRLLTIAAAQASVAIENAQLYESLRKSYSELEQAYNELRELDKMKSEFVQNISHELRTPLTFIKGYIELLVDGDMGELTEDQSMAADIIATKSEALSRLVDDIISLQQAGREQLRCERLSLAELAHAAIQAAQASAIENEIILRDEIPDSLVAPVMVDKRRLVQVFDNLLGNAIKFSNPGDTVTVRMYEEETAIRTEVEDTGIGIPADKVSRIFDRFYQVDGTTTRRFGGTGLGLTIVKQIVEVHGGQVGVESKAGHGSLFYFTLPQAAAL
jgi:GAF domain-containing protein